jgi:hypothetical protein
MPGAKPEIVRIFRIVHIDNVEYLLIHGMFAYNHPNSDPTYINIGDTSLMSKRKAYPVALDPPGGMLGDYVPFYFGPLSPMLLKIRDGNGGVTKRPQSDIVYIVCKVDDIVAHCNDWCFTDGHAKTAISEFYSDLQMLTEVDWNMVGAKYWMANEEDMDRARRKQAEFLIKSQVSVNCINCIVVYNEEKRTLVQSIVDRLGLKIAVLVNPNNKFYY